MERLECELDCCFRMYEVPGSENWLTDCFLGDHPEDGCLFAICAATKEAWEAEVNAPTDDNEEYVRGVPVDCPIYQGEVTPPWED